MSRKESFLSTMTAFAAAQAMFEKNGPVGDMPKVFGDPLPMFHKEKRRKEIKKPLYNPKRLAAWQPPAERLSPRTPAIILRRKRNKIARKSRQINRKPCRQH